MTAIGVSSYLVYLNQPTLALFSAIVFSKIIIFHFVIDIYDRIKSKKLKTSVTCSCTVKS
jgi:hypothetical protein